eukprot:CAMPEP_0197175796 /NCGR_PEP_ID=MMETSP1423-20130617/1921_1 /TAXON_ID=476441 /ORGANISM="Pseudo-nitzschia heimii, Strain UNC1101" /LENGTH=158 /DNA_ID=CAMNT_0042625037 /DNA_START=257 /DNA_END=730 /DNA_ORIENTATION=+
MVPSSSTPVSYGKTTYGSGSLDATPWISQDHNESQSSDNSDATVLSSEFENNSDENPDMEIDRYSCTWKEYIFSLRFLELMVCVLPFLAMFHYLEITTIVPHMRPLPFQHVHSNEMLHKNFVWNPVNSEKYTGDTITHREYHIFGFLCPLILQLALVW